MRKRRLLVVLTILFAFLHVQSASALDRYITITSSGTIKVKPDTVRINVTAWATANSSALALDQAKSTSSKVRTILNNFSIQSQYLKSSSLNVFPEYNYTPDKGSVLLDYKASQTFEIIVRAANNAGQIVDALVEAGGNNLSIDGVTPFLYDSSVASESARITAVKAAKVKVNSYAKLLGTRIGKITYLEESTSPNTYPVMMAQAKSDIGATVIDLGTQDLTVTITTRWALL